MTLNHSFWELVHFTDKSYENFNKIDPAVLEKEQFIFENYNSYDKSSKLSVSQDSGLA